MNHVSLKRGRITISEDRFDDFDSDQLLMIILPALKLPQIQGGLKRPMTIHIFHRGHVTYIYEPLNPTLKNVLKYIFLKNQLSSKILHNERYMDEHSQISKLNR